MRLQQLPDEIPVLQSGPIFPGRSVNTAARIESAGEAGRVNSFQTTWQLVQAEIPAEYRGTTETKIKEAMAMDFV